ncbi:LCP family protein [Psychromicrobium xiongbiense]|uniref:LCP family glycopolymer transferase n=1 Tax=Psychromicrobium xiongbiense TaxID=3051184 RepID=UPI002552A02D|nr:LCP family protein [Psychromicrobium sp. YIM S02556]
MTFSSPQRNTTSGKPALLTNPVRYPQTATAPMRSKRALLLLALTVFFPGSAQLVAGNRRLGRAALRVTIAAWLALIVLGILALTARSVVLGWFTHPVGSVIIILVLSLLAVGWAVLFINTLRLIKPVLLAPGMRAIVCGALVVLMVICSGTLGYAAYLVNSGRSALGSIFTTAGPDMKPVNGRYNFLVMGGDAGADRVGRRPDSIIVLSIDATTGKTVTISIPRNLENAQFSDGSPMKSVYPKGYNCGDNCIINFLYSEVTQKYSKLYPNAKDPGAQAMMEAAGGTLGLTIQGYVLIDMDGFSQMVDALGGVTINAGGWVPMSGAATDEVGGHEPPVGWISPGVHKLNGQQALWYARSRQWVNDYARSQRQQCIQQAILKQMDPATVLAKFDSIANAGAQVIESDLPQQQLGSFLDLAIKAKGFPLDRLTIGPPDFDINFPVSPDFGVLHQRVADFIAGKPAPAATDSGQAAGQGAQQPAAPQPAAPAPAQQPAPQPAPQNTVPQVTEAQLQKLAVTGQDDQLAQLLANNGNCTPG